MRCLTDHGGERLPRKSFGMHAEICFALQPHWQTVSCKVTLDLGYGKDSVVEH